MKIFISVLATVAVSKTIPVQSYLKPVNNVEIQDNYVLTDSENKEAPDHQSNNENIIKNKYPNWFSNRAEKQEEKLPYPEQPNMWNERPPVQWTQQPTRWVNQPMQWANQPTQWVNSGQWYNGIQQPVRVERPVYQPVRDERPVQVKQPMGVKQPVRQPVKWSQSKNSMTDPATMMMLMENEKMKDYLPYFMMNQNPGKPSGFMNNYFMMKLLDDEAAEADDDFLPYLMMSNNGPMQNNPMMMALMMDNESTSKTDDLLPLFMMNGNNGQFQNNNNNAMMLALMMGL